MTEIEQKALALVNDVCRERGEKTLTSFHTLTNHRFIEALCRAIEQHEAFRQEVSDAVVAYVGTGTYLGKFNDTLGRFIIAKPDPLVEAVNEAWGWRNPHEDVTENLRAAIEKRGGKIVWGEG